MQLAKEVLDFWFVEHGQEDWFASSDEFDAKLKERFFGLHAQVAIGEASAWRATPEGRVAEIIVLDQFSRQFFRERPEAFATDGMALVLAQELVASGLDKMLTKDQRFFAYMPFMHSESLIVHDTAQQVFIDLGNEGNLKFEQMHLEILRKFGRYPKRNEALERTSTQEELDYISSRDGKLF